MSAVAGRAAEPTYLPFPESEPGELDAGGAAALVARSLPGYHALLVGCGAGPGARDKGAGQAAAVLRRAAAADRRGCRRP